MEELLAVILSMVLVFALVPILIWKRRQDSRSQRGEEEEEEQEPQVARRETAVRATGAARRMRRRPAAGASSSSTPSAREETVDEIDDEAVADEYEGGAMTKRERKRQEREAQRQAEQASRELKLSKQEYYDKMRRKKDEEREALERKLEEEAAAQKAKEEEAAALEFEKWKGEFSVDAEGIMENEEQYGTRSLLDDFVEYIKKHKCVPLEDLAAEFKLRTQECINRIASLESMGRISGVMDDRGKYIYISPEEMKAVAEYIKSRGRVSISHLACKSNQFIDLEPKPQFVEEISGDTEEIRVS